jgi:hypothetical protein
MNEDMVSWTAIHDCRSLEELYDLPLSIACVGTEAAFVMFRSRLTRRFCAWSFIDTRAPHVIELADAPPFHAVITHWHGGWFNYDAPVDMANVLRSHRRGEAAGPLLIGLYTDAIGGRVSRESGYPGPTLLVLLESFDLLMAGMEFGEISVFLRIARALWNHTRREGETLLGWGVPCYSLVGWNVSVDVQFHDGKVTPLSDYDRFHDYAHRKRDMQS